MILPCHSSGCTALWGGTVAWGAQKQALDYGSVVHTSDSDHGHMANVGATRCAQGWRKDVRKGVRKGCRDYQGGHKVLVP